MFNNYIHVVESGTSMAPYYLKQFLKGKLLVLHGLNCEIRQLKKHNLLRMCGLELSVSLINLTDY